MARKKQGADRMVRVAEGVYKRGDAYLVPIYHADLNGPGRGGKKWHSLSRCGPDCRHAPIVDRESARDAKRLLESEKRITRRNGQPEETADGWMGSRSGETPRWLDLFPRKEQTTNIHNAERVRGFAKHFEGRLLKSLTEDEVWAWAEDNQGQVKEVRAALNDAKRMRLLDDNPLTYYRQAQRRGRRDIETLSIAELDQLVEVAHATWGDYGERMGALIELAAWTGMRPGELFLLSKKRGNEQNGGRVNQVHARGWIDVQWQWNAKVREIKRPKWDSMRRVVLLPRARAALDLLPMAPEGWMFTTQRDARFSQRNLHYYWDPVRRRFTDSLPSSHWLSRRVADLGNDGNLDFYELRHFFGTALAHPPAGIRPASPYEIAQQMGHKDGGQLAMQVYIHTKGSDVIRDLGDAWAAHEPRARPAA